LIETAIKKGLGGIIITDHDNVKGGLIGKKLAKAYKGFIVIPGVEVTSYSGHILAIGIDENIPKNLSVEETVERIHDLGGVAVASHPFSKLVRKSLKGECLKTDAIEVFNATNKIGANERALLFARTNKKPQSAGSDAHWARNVGDAGIICDNPVEDLRKGRAKIFGDYTKRWDLARFMIRKFKRSVKWRISRERKVHKKNIF